MNDQTMNDQTMSDQTIETTASPHVSIPRHRGNLIIRGWGETRIEMRSYDRYGYRGDQQGDHRGQRWSPEVRTGFEQTTGQPDETDAQTRVTLNAYDDSRPFDSQIYVPYGATLSIGQAGGNLHISQIQGEVKLERCRGNLTLDETAAVQIDRVDGNLHAQSIAGDCRINRAGGHASIRDCQGDLTVERCGGHLHAFGIEGAVQGHAGGHAKVQVGGPDACRIALKAGGHINCRVPSTADAAVQIRCGGQVRVRDLGTSPSNTLHHAEFDLGQGAGSISLHAGGNVLLAAAAGEGSDVDIDMDFDLGSDIAERASEIMQQINEQIEGQLGAMAGQLDARLSELDSDEIAQHVQERVQRAMQKMEEKLNRTLRRAEAKAQRYADREIRRGRGHHGRPHAGGPTPPTPPVSPGPGREAAPQPAAVSDEERMAILRMLEEGKISVEQAERLLSALEA